MRKNAEKEMEKLNGSSGWTKPDFQVPTGKLEKEPADDKSGKKNGLELPEITGEAKKDEREDRDGGGHRKDQEPVSVNVPRNARRNQTIQIAPDEPGKRFYRQRYYNF